jgi:hypothetical protein
LRLAPDAVGIAIALLNLLPFDPKATSNPFKGLAYAIGHPVRLRSSNFCKSHFKRFLFVRHEDMKPDVIARQRGAMSLSPGTPRSRTVHSPRNSSEAKITGSVAAVEDGVVFP